MSKLYFFRHAQASFGAANYDVLSPKGELQAAELGKYLANQQYTFDKIYVGPLRRQQHTFEIVQHIFNKNGLSMPEPIVLDGLKEHRATAAMRTAMPELIKTVPLFQELTKKSKADPRRQKANMMRGFQYFLNEWAEGNIEVPGILPWADFRKEVKEGLTHILQQTNSGETVGAFTSGGTISSIAGHSLNMTDQKRIAAMNYAIRNTSFTSFLYSKNQFNLLTFNELPHLNEEMITFI